MQPTAVLSLLVLCLALSGCGGNNIGHKHPVTGICKSCKPYFVRGSWHHPQAHYHYDEIGLASWYGPGFHGKPKPYGELFNQHSMTAAHKTLPLPTIVLVTNLETGKTIKVLVDDRGPFVYEGRIIDLSMGSAKALGCYNKGIGKVRVQALVEESKALSSYLTRYGPSGRDPSGRTWWEIYEQEIDGRHGDEVASGPSPIPPPEAIPPKAQSVATPASPPPTLPAKLAPSLDNLLKDTAPYAPAKQKKSASATTQTYVQVGGDFVQRKNAEALLESVILHYPAKVIEIHLKGQKFYAVQAGPFPDQKTAQEALKKLDEKSQLHSIVTG
ncbi:septal ring lytic transglycosylase RlpA family protein [Candidatus Finniella inopinata]|uniref:Endolytic peptidoglycan transglycosylase RlpA n=1 Tax=Candidatus Finniella inopinata TaxID=1696036 RepID=A0A4Q7DIV3_9PROT|nr:septal ring lytic transglycosylase RlpA family protein [Candidatus Finniella inopinata]RZI46228.1 septal ring lytic transglycosylase RlpA family protein [Candidatus Finniella inopinata]